jgi:hypothetical protein
LTKISFRGWKKLMETASGNWKPFVSGKVPLRWWYLGEAVTLLPRCTRRSALWRRSLSFAALRGVAVSYLALVA